MPFDPSKPADDSPLDAQEMRDQLNALDAKIAAQQAALADTPHNPNLSPLNLALSDPPTRNEVQQILDAFNTLLNQITRV